MRLLTILIFILGFMGFSSTLMAQDPQANSSLFQHSENCVACHSNLISESGRDVSIGHSWRASMMANSAKDPYWHAAVRREITDHPQATAAIQNECSTCHMPMARFQSRLTGGDENIFANIADSQAATPSNNTHLAMDGVSCSVCHQIQPDNFGDESSFVGHFAIDTKTPWEQRQIFGPYEIDVGRQHVMQSASAFTPVQGTHIQESELCATCHTLYTHALDEAGNAAGRLPEQVPYLEWLNSDFREGSSCQSCHMPQLAELAPISSVVGDPRDQFNQHVFRGGNAFMIGILAENREELDIVAPKGELEFTRRRTIEYLESNAALVRVNSLSLSDNRLEFRVAVENLAGHKLPTAYPSRRVWLHVTVTDASGRTVFESGRVRSDGSIEGNDNDMDGSRFEPHYDLIERADQVQIYEPILADSKGQVTTGLIYAAEYLKDNRILPRGFDKEAAGPDIDPHGAAASDNDFIGGSDRLTYRIPVGESQDPYSIEVELLYQSIGYRWANNLRDYDTFETNRFVGYYEKASSDSAVRLAQTNARVNP